MAHRVLSDGVVLLDPPTEDDVDAITRACQDAELARWVPVPVPYSTDDARGFLANVAEPGWESGREPTWAIRELDRTLLGLMSVRLGDAGSGEIGYWMAPWGRRRGACSRALQVVLDEAFHPEGMDLDRVVWRAVVGNWPSRRVAWRAGFRVEGTLRAELVDRGGVRRDAWVGTLLRTDPREPNEPWPHEGLVTTTERTHA